MRRLSVLMAVIAIVVAVLPVEAAAPQERSAAGRATTGSAGRRLVDRHPAQGPRPANRGAGPGQGRRRPGHPGLRACPAGLRLPGLGQGGRALERNPNVRTVVPDAPIQIAAETTPDRHPAHPRPASDPARRPRGGLHRSRRPHRHPRHGHRPRPSRPEHRRRPRQELHDRRRRRGWPRPRDARRGHRGCDRRQRHRRRRRRTGSDGRAVQGPRRHRLRRVVEPHLRASTT